MDVIEKAEKYSEILKNILGSDIFLNELLSALGSYNIIDYCEYIARNNDIDLEEELEQFYEV